MDKKYIFQHYIQQTNSENSSGIRNPLNVNLMGAGGFYIVASRKGK